jgi:DegV family protein with EDD domain
MIGICTDSHAQLPAELAQRFGVEVVPLTLRIDGREYLEGHDLDADSFYELYADGRRPEVHFAEPSPGQFAVAYDELASRGCTQILSIHTALAAGCTLRAARLAAHCSPVPVRLVDSRTSRFGVSCTVWAAGTAIARGATLDEAALVAESLAPSIGNVFIASGLSLGRRPAATDSISNSMAKRPVYSLMGEDLQSVGHVESMAEAIHAIAMHALRHGLTDGCAEGEPKLRVAVGHAHRDTQAVADAITHAVGESARVVEVLPFRIGPSVGVESGPGTVGCVMFPA